MSLSLEEIDAQIEELEAILPRLEKASTEKHTHSDAGWWLTMAGSSGGTALAVAAGNQAHELDTMLTPYYLRPEILTAVPNLVEINSRVIQGSVKLASKAGLAVHHLTILCDGAEETDLADPCCHKQMAPSLREFLSRWRS